ncbi:hypothetical protein HPB51_019140 [Rhipicephalus microplus]|uniref:Uncharacterized protein n=1 Tax=Rhipicephalus microplus TaxID=6941 RepID=A0A9J6EIQ9_RHIMP|nr:hypothetical protein HPB51_019140 [Rhipicephalus microplus]
MSTRKTRQQSKFERKKDDPRASTAPDDAKGVSPALQENASKSTTPVNLGAAVPGQVPPAEPAPNQPVSIVAAGKGKEGRRHRCKKSTVMIDEGAENTVVPAQKQPLGLGTVAGNSGAGAVPKTKGMTATGQVSPRVTVATSGPDDCLEAATTGVRQDVGTPPPSAFAAPVPPPRDRRAAASTDKDFRHFRRTI